MHAGYGAFSLQLSIGKLLLLSFGLLILSGIVWRIAYVLLPPIAAKDVGNYSQAASADLASRLLVEIEKLAAGRSPQFHELKRWVVDERPARAAADRAAGSLDPSERQVLVELLLADRRARALDRQKRQARYVVLLQGWRFLHVPLVFAVLLLLPLHIVMAYDLPARLVPPRSGSRPRSVDSRRLTNARFVTRRSSSEWRN